MARETRGLIDGIEAATGFSPRESALCGHCEYQDLCPLRKHLFSVGALPEDESRSEPGVALVDRYAGLRAEKDRVEGDIESVRDALVDYARRQQVEVVWGTDNKARIVLDHKLRFTGKGDVERKELELAPKKAGKWDEVSDLSTPLLLRAIADRLWDRELIEQVMEHGRLEESSSVRLSRLKDEGS